jgi:putative ATP-binding cassette transporter
VLDEMGLKDCVARAGGLDAEQDWAKILNEGELQALTFARLLLANPRFAFLDNPTRAIAAPLAEQLYRALAHSTITYLSAGCPPSLLSYHDTRLEIHDDGSWQIETLGRQKQPSQEKAEQTATAAFGQGIDQSDASKFGGSRKPIAG